MTKSEFFRDVLDAYFEKSKKEKISARGGPVFGWKIQNEITERDLAHILKLYWDARASVRQKVIIVCLAIIERYHKILIGARSEKDKWVENLTWVFPGGRIRSLNFEKQLKREVKKETNLNIKIKNLVSARIHPDSGFKDIQIVALYFHCKAKRGKELPGGDLSELKWVKPSDVFKYFTTSTSDEVTQFLHVLEKNS